MLRRILIVDDEVYVVDGLFEKLNQHFGARVDLVRAYSAGEAINCIEQMYIDIVLSDINMPAMNGFELCERIRMQWPGCQIIFLTAYDSFDYAYRVLKTSGARFLLKSEGFDKIIDELEQSLASLQETTQAQFLLQTAKAILDTNQEKLRARSEVFQSILQAGAAPSPQQIERLEAHGALDPSLPVLCCMGNVSDKLSLPLQELLADQLWSAQFAFTTVQVSEQRSFWLFQQKPLLSFDGEKVLQTLRGLLEKFQMICDEQYGVHLCFTVLRHAIPWTRLNQAHLILFNAMDDAQHVTLRFINNFDDNMDDGETSTLLALLHQAKKSASAMEIVHKVHDYIQHEYANNITLSDIAGYVHLNPAYLSRLYKQTCGINLFEYLSSVRVKVAQERLLHTDDKISDIAFDVGFNSIGYFCSTFRKHTGMTPQTYRTEVQK